MRDYLSLNWSQQVRNSLAICLVCLGSTSVFARFAPIAMVRNSASEVLSQDTVDQDLAGAQQESPLARTLESFPLFFPDDSKPRLQIAQGGRLLGGGDPNRKKIGRMEDSDESQPEIKNKVPNAPNIKDLPVGPGGRKRPPATTGPDPYVSKFPAGSIDDSLSAFCTAVEDDDFAPFHELVTVLSRIRPSA